MELLLGKAADAVLADSAGRTPLYWAVYFSYTPCVRLLREHGAKDTVGW